MQQIGKFREFYVKGGQASSAMRSPTKPNFAPRKQNVGVMVVFFGGDRDTHDEAEGSVIASEFEDTY
jgi:hypothetical protein